MRKGSREEALAQFQEASRLNPAFAAPVANIALIEEALGHPNQAEQLFARALVLQPSYTPALHSLARIKMQQGRDQEARQYLLRALDFNPNDVSVLINSGVIYNKLGEYSDAIPLLQKTFEVGKGHPHLYLAHYHLGEAYLSLNALDAARKEFQEAYRLNPSFEPAQSELQRLGN